MPREWLQFGAFAGSILIAAYSIANMNTTRFDSTIVHKDPIPIDDEKNLYLDGAGEPVETPKIKKRHQKSVSLQEEYARLHGLAEWEYKPVPRQ